MDIYELLKKDHRHVKELFSKIKKRLEDEDFSEASELFEEMKTELGAHAKAEEEVFYEPLRQASRGDKDLDLVGEAKEEHHVVALLLNELSRLDVKEKEWKAKLTVLSEMVEHHVEEEEEEMFKRAKRLFSEQDAEQMAENMKSLKEEYKEDIDSALAEDIYLFSDPSLKNKTKSSRDSLTDRNLI